MPSFVTHHVFAEHALERFEEPVRALAERQSGAYFWGAQGPDPLVYHDMPFRGPLVPLCAALHEADPAPLFAALAKAARGKAAYAAWTLGFAVHYALDRALEPLLRAAAREKIAPARGEDMQTAYLRAAADLDRAVIEEYLSGAPGDYPAHRLLPPLDGDARLSAADQLSRAASLTEGQTVSFADCLSALNAMRMTVPTLRTGEAARRALVTAETRAGCPGRLSARQRPDLPLPGDVPNRAHAVWRDGADSPRDEDAFTLFEQALSDAAALASAVFEDCMRAQPVPLRLLDENFYGVPVERG